MLEFFTYYILINAICGVFASGFYFANNRLKWPDLYSERHIKKSVKDDIEFCILLTIISGIAFLISALLNSNFGFKHGWTLTTKPVVK